MKYYDRVKDTTTTTGTGTITVSGAPPTGYDALSTIPVGTKIEYVIELSSEWEVGEGTVLSATTMSRDRVRDSSNAGSLVNFSAGTKNFWVNFSAAQAARANTGRRRVIPPSLY